MPTKKPRHLITETEQVSRALAAAAKRWPDESTSRTRLLVKLVEEGRRAIVEKQKSAISDRQRVIARTGGAITGAYEPNYLAELREDWPT